MFGALLTKITDILSEISEVNSSTAENANKKK